MLRMSPYISTCLIKIYNQTRLLHIVNEFKGAILYATYHNSAIAHIVAVSIYCPNQMWP